MPDRRIMPDKEKVIDDLEEQIAWIRDNDFHKFPGWGHSVLAMRDALELLKAQEPMEPVFERTFMSDIEIYDCGKCGTSLGAKGIAKYCMNCGQAVKWE